jgi:predicted Fe-S protein YdhL (DUF1289 family)
MVPIESPCVKVCTLDAQAGACTGCGRTLDEIARWLKMSPAERSQIMAELPARLAARDERKAG